MAKDLRLQARDNEGQLGTATLGIADGTLDADIETLRGAVNAVTLGNPFGAKVTEEIVKTAVSNADPNNGEVERGKKWKVYFTRSGGSSGSFTIPCADWSTADGAGKMDILTPASVGANLKAAIEAIALDNGETITVDMIIKQGYAS